MRDRNKGSRENGIQCIIRLLGYGGHTERLGLRDEARVSTKHSAHFNKVRGVEITTALELETKSGYGN